MSIWQRKMHQRNHLRVHFLQKVLKQAALRIGSGIMHLNKRGNAKRVLKEREGGVFFDRMLDDNNDLKEGSGDSISKQDRRSSGSGWRSSRKARAASPLSLSPSSPPFPPRERSASSPLLPQLRSAGRRLSFGKSSPRADRRSRESSQEGAVSAKLQDGSVSPKRVTEDGPQSPMCGERIGNYSVVRMIGHGGEGPIYLVVHEES